MPYNNVLDEISSALSSLLSIENLTPSSNALAETQLEVLLKQGLPFFHFLPSDSQNIWPLLQPHIIPRNTLTSTFISRKPLFSIPILRLAPSSDSENLTHRKRCTA